MQGKPVIIAHTIHSFWNQSSSKTLHQVAVLRSILKWIRRVTRLLLFGVLAPAAASSQLVEVNARHGIQLVGYVCIFATATQDWHLHLPRHGTDVGAEGPPSAAKAGQYRVGTRRGILIPKRTQVYLLAGTIEKCEVVDLLVTDEKILEQSIMFGLVGSLTC